MKKAIQLIGLLFLFLAITTTLQSQDFDGYALYNNTNSNTTYLIDKNGDIAHTWSLERPCNYTVLLMENGNLMRGAVNQGNQINGAAVGGLVQEIDPQGNVVWEFTYSGADHVAHHDITLMPDGNVLLTAWEVKSQAELQALGYDGNSTQKYPTHFVEVSQIGDTNEGEIVWEWHILDHMVQDVNPNLPNFGVVAEHPELMDINVAVQASGGPGGGGGGDWFHVNGVDYSPELDLITFSSRFLSEIFVIDHSTTSEEAAGHTGGNSGKGGDFLYRWGNPANFGANGTRTIDGPVHDARWIPNDGRPRGGYIQFFNNDGPNGGGSTVDALELPFAADGINFEWTPGEQYAPASASWQHICLDNANGQSASNSMPNGNTFVVLSNEYLYEVDEEDNIVWQYGAQTRKGFRYTCDHPGIQFLINEGIIEDLCLINAAEDIAAEVLTITPNPSAGFYQINGLPSDYQVEAIQVFDAFGKLILTKKTVTAIDLSTQTAGVYLVSVRLDNGQLISKKVMKQ